MKKKKMIGKYAKEAWYALLGCFIWFADFLFGGIIHEWHLNWGWWFLVAFIFLVGGFLIAVGTEIISIEMRRIKKQG